MNIIRWGDIAFFATTEMIRGLRDLSISASCETSDSKMGGEKVTKKKNTGAYQISFTAMLNAYLGEDVQATALAMTEAARDGLTGYFYAAENKLFPCSFMMTSAKINEIHYAPNGTWTKAEVAVELKQCTKYDGTVSNGRRGGKLIKYEIAPGLFTWVTVAWYEANVGKWEEPTEQTTPGQSSMLEWLLTHYGVTTPPAGSTTGSTTGSGTRGGSGTGGQTGQAAANGTTNAAREASASQTTQNAGTGTNPSAAASNAGQAAQGFGSFLGRLFGM